MTDFADICGHEAAKRALTVALAAAVRLVMAFVTLAGRMAASA